jgi:hypothetical protein
VKPPIVEPFFVEPPVGKAHLAKESFLDKVIIEDPSFEEAAMNFLASSKAAGNMCKWKKREGAGGGPGNS